MELLPASYTAHAQSADHSCFGQRTEPVRIDSSFTYLANPSICKMPVHRRDPNNQNVRKFRSKTQWIGSVQPEKFRKTGPPFEVDHFSRSDPSEFWLNGSRRFGEHRRVHRRSILNHHYSATPLNSFQSTLDIQSTTFVSISSWNRSNSDAVREQGHPKSIFGKYLFGRRLEI